MRNPIANWSWDEADMQAAAQTAVRLPSRAFDAHAHCYRIPDLCAPAPPLMAGGPATCDIHQWRASLGRQMPGVELQGGLLFPIPARTVDLAAANAFLGAELVRESACRGLMLVRPAMSRSDAERTLENPGFVGFKPYHLMGNYDPSFQAPLSEFLPQWVWELADERGLSIMLHIVRDRALSDPDNQREIRQQCLRYPNARLILAHAARGFHAPNTVRAIDSIADLQNVWFDTSGVCEAAPIAAIIRAFGPRKLMWGSDYPINEQRGKCVTVGDGFSWINPTSVDPSNPNAPQIHTLPVGIESILALLEATDQCFLNADDLQDIFANNARLLLGLETPTSRDGALYAHAKTVIPGGGHLLSKRPEMMAPGHWPTYFREVRGCEVWDLDGRHFYDMSHNAVGACLLGMRHPAVTRAVQRRILLGNISSLNPPEEVALADRLCALHPWAEQARFARTGGEIAAVAVRIARATTGRSQVAICGYHGWHDWYLAANLGDDDSLRGHLLPGLDPAGVPAELTGTVHAFRHGYADQLERICAQHGDKLAAIVLEPCRYENPAPGFLERVRELAHQVGAILIFDEISIGWRQCLGGDHLRHGVSPDMALFGKTLGNGHPIAAVLGTRPAMAGAEGSFISSSYWTESTGYAAALATLDEMERVDAAQQIAGIGVKIQAILRAAADRHQLPMQIDGFPCAPRLQFLHDHARELRTLYTRHMLDEGFLAGAMCYVTLAHTDPILADFASAVDRSFGRLVDTIQGGTIHAELGGLVAHDGFRRLL